MYTVKVRSKFSSAHNLREYKGKCEELHGHNWNVEVCVSSEDLDSLGMVIDFKELKKSVNVIVDELDHTYINEMEYFKDVNPTSENLAKYIHNRLQAELRDLKVSEITVWETETSSASYSE